MRNSQEEFPVVFNEVCLDDFYRLRDCPIVPTTILDLGANVGAFTTFARFMFPQALILALEPDQRNFSLLKKYTSHLPDVTLLQKALGVGEIWQGLPKLEPPYYGATRSYVSVNQLGFPLEELTSPPGLPGRDDYPKYEPAKVEAIGLHEIVSFFVGDINGVFLKIDCEGGENYLFAHTPSMQILRQIPVIAIETHYYTKGTGEQYEINHKLVQEGLLSLKETHHCLLNEQKRLFYAVRKDIHVKNSNCPCCQRLLHTPCKSSTR